MKKIFRRFTALLIAVVVFMAGALECAAEDDWLDYFFWDFFSDYEEFSTSLKPKFTAEVNDYGVLLLFDYVENASFYRIYRYDKKRKEYVKLDDTNYTSYLDTDVNSNASYTYKIRVYRDDGTQREKSKLSSKVTIKTPLMPVNVRITVTDRKITLDWKKDTGVDGYEVYYYQTVRMKSDLKGSSGYDNLSGNIIRYGESRKSLNYAEEKADFKRLKRTTADSLSIKRNKKYKYYFKVRSYKIKDGKRKYSEFSDIIPASRVDAVFNGMKGKTRSTVEVISYRSDIEPWTMKISENDREIFQQFEKEHFTNNMSYYEKAEYLAQYIHYNVDYAYGDDFAKLSGISCAEAVFKKHSGQCYQYNGALAEFLAYMGFDVKLVSGYRGTGTDNRWSHYWCEITIDGKKYILDAGNKKDGLYGFFGVYENSRYLTDQ
ncbi:MAG: arylamine N-acetyltransferase [Bacteroides sp.]|nr:arylamine N-acetyltransferase [Eubacterium sp.]MCM1418003.1 arylamine N-acetyltransferase [Roseburia sp.]MCM1462174.1 arylamine N-acetyltransferase [Bacteroides sp.]